jgi:CHAT domain-containing protein
MLPAAHKEITTVSSYAAQGTVILENSDLNRHTFDHSWKRVGDFRLVHFATHAVNRGSQHNSFILLRCDRALEAVYGDEIARDHMQANLIVLSTCNSASGEVLSAHGVDSVAMAFLSAGNRCVIASRSDVQDNDVASFVGSLYRSLALGRTPEEAVRSAQKGLRSASHGNAVFESYGACNIAVPIHPRTLTTVFLIKERWIGVLIAIAVLGSVIGVLYRRRYLRRRYQAAVNP